MSYFGKKLLKAFFVLSLIGSSVAYASTKAAQGDAHAALQTLETKSTHAADWVGGKTDIVRQKWDRLEVGNKVQAFQHKTRPLGQKLSATLGPKTEPVFRAVKEGERRMSIPAILLVLVFGGVFVFMGMSGPTSRLGGRH